MQLKCIRKISNLVISLIISFTDFIFSQALRVK